jgi:hypothetical protein
LREVHVLKSTYALLSVKMELIGMLSIAIAPSSVQTPSAKVVASEILISYAERMETIIL